MIPAAILDAGGTARTDGGAHRPEPWQSAVVLGRDGIEWVVDAGDAACCSMNGDADGMHSLLVLRADKLAGCTEGSEEEAELKMLVDTISSYEAKRWPDGKVPGGKG